MLLDNDSEYLFQWLFLSGHVPMISYTYYYDRVYDDNYIPIAKPSKPSYLRMLQCINAQILTDERERFFFLHRRLIKNVQAQSEPEVSVAAVE